MTRKADPNNVDPHEADPSTANEDWMKPDSPSPWRALGWRFLGCLLLMPLLLATGRVLPEAVALLLSRLPILLWLAALALFAQGRFWRDPRPLWGRIPLDRPAEEGLALRLLATLLTLILGLVAFLLAFAILAIPFAGGHAPI